MIKMQKLLWKIFSPSSSSNSHNFTRNLNSGVRKSLEIGARVTVIRKITENDIIEFAKLTNDFNPIHVNSPKPIVHGALLNGLLSGVLGTKLPGPGTIVIEQQLYYKKPCYAGDSVEITVEVLSWRRIIKCAYKLVANSERIVLEGEGKFMMTEVETKSNTSSD